MIRTIFVSLFIMVAVSVFAQTDTTSADIVAYIFFYFTSVITCYLLLQAN